ncbi:MAG: hypothetical protein WA160_05570 [Pseudobdellovibrio sp.]
MESKIVFFSYLETHSSGFSKDLNPFSLTVQAKELNFLNYTVFKNCGGLQIIDYFKDNKTHVRSSLWNSAASYQNWLTHPKIISYLDLRKKYHLSYQIVDYLEGPFEATQFNFYLPQNVDQ